MPAELPGSCDLGTSWAEYYIYRFVTNSSKWMGLTQMYLITLGSLYFNLKHLVSQVRSVEWKKDFFSLIEHLLVSFLHCPTILMLQRKEVFSLHSFPLWHSLSYSPIFFYKFYLCQLRTLAYLISIGIFIPYCHYVFFLDLLYCFWLRGDQISKW